MRILKYVLYVGLIIISLQAEEKVHDEYIGILYENQEAAGKNKDTKLALKIWVNEIVTNKFSGTIGIKTYDKTANALNDFIGDKVHNLSVGAVTYLEHKNEIDPLVMQTYAFYEDKEELEGYFLIVNKKSGIESIKGLKNRTLGVRHGAGLTTLYADHLLLSNGLASHEKVFDEVFTFESHSKALLKTFFGKIDACIVPKNIWRTMSEMNPQIKKKMEVLDQSPSIFTTSLMFVHQNCDPDFAKVNENTSKQMYHIPRAKQILTLLKVERYEKIDQSTLEPMINYYTEAQQMKKRYSQR